MENSFYLTLQCMNRPGIVAAVSTCLFEAGANILEAQQFDDLASGRFFMRVVFDTQTAATEQHLSEAFSPIADRFSMQWKIRNRARSLRTLLLVSKQDHCLGDLLYRMRMGEMPMEVVGIISNHPKASHALTLIGEIPYHHLPVKPETKLEQEKQIRDIVSSTSAELVVLARYMQILSEGMSAFLAGRCINIHHSFLPGFKGAKPYNQAFDRGVKMIGATAHYVNDDLDEGPIIVQDTESVTHTDTPESLTRKGRDIECRVLARAVSYHLEDRVLINGAKTIVFRE